MRRTPTTLDRRLASRPAAPARPVVGPGTTAPWSATAEQVLLRLEVDPERGLASDQAAARLAEVGANDVRLERPPSLSRSVVAQLRETMIVVLLVALGLTLATADVADATVIALVVAVNATMGVVQERKALRAVTALRSLAAPSARVRRDGRVQSVPTSTLVPGDVLLVKEGDVVAADARLLEAHDLEVDESLLTGESTPSGRQSDAPLDGATPVADRVTMLHAGTTVTYGRGEAVVVGTGASSQVGNLAGLLESGSAPLTPLQRRLRRLGQALSVAAVVACVVVVLLGLLRGQSLETMLLTGISLAVAAIPESLPAVVTLALAGAAHRMAGRGAIVRSLPAVETLGSVTLLATDKTGTLTRGAMECVAAWTPVSSSLPLTGPEVPADAAELLTWAVLCNDAPATAPGAAGASTEAALVAAARAHGIDVAEVRRRRPRLREIPFTSARRSMTTWHAGAEGLEITKGAPEAVLGALEDDATAQEAADIARTWASQGRRVLAVTVARDGQPPALAGLLALADPPRAEARDAVLACRRAGIRPVLVTGDHPGTAQAIAAAVGLVGATGAESGLPGTAGEVRARIDPAGKLALIRDWQSDGEVVAMTGDGVNDAPALRAADIGVAMGVRGTDVAKQAADIVLTDDSLSTVVAAVGEGRRVFDNVRRFVRYGVSGGLAEIAVMVVGPFLGLALPLLPAQILWVNLVTHGLPGVAMGAEAAEPDVLRRPPRPPSEGVVTRPVAVDIAVLGGAITAACVAVALRAQSVGAPWQSSLFVTLALAQLTIALATRSSIEPMWRQRWSGNPMLLLAVALSAALTVAALYVAPLAELLHTDPLQASELGLAALAAVVPALVYELLKAGRRRWGRPPRTP